MRNKLTAILLSVLMIIAAFTIPGCKLTEDETDPGYTSAPEVSELAESTDVPDAAVTEDIEIEPTEEVIYTPWPENVEYDASSIVMRCNSVEMNMYDFGQGFYSSQYLQYLMYGMISADQYCNMVVDDLSTVLYLVNEAKQNGAELSEDEIVEIDTLIDNHVEKVIQSYVDQVEEGVEDREAEGMKNFEKDLAEDGLTVDSFITLAKNNLRLHKLAEEYYNTLAETVRASDDEVMKYVADNKAEAESLTIADFVDRMDTFINGGGAFPLYIVDDCFSVNHIYLAYETESSEEEITYLTESRSADEAAVEAALPELQDFAAFMEYADEKGDDPGMEPDSPYRKYGYIIHPDLVDDYFGGFVYAAMNLHNGSWSAPVDAGAENTPAPDPELKFFTLKDGERVVKVCTESGVHYIIVNKEYKRGDTQYEIGDDIWESWRTAASETSLNELYENLSAEWKQKYTVEVDYATIRDKYSVSEDDLESDND